MKGNLLVQAAFASLTQHGQLGKTMIETVRGMTSTCTVNWTYIAQLRHFGVEICRLWLLGSSDFNWLASKTAKVL